MANIVNTSCCLVGVGSAGNVAFFQFVHAYFVSVLIRLCAFCILIAFERFRMLYFSTEI